jgi:hypothetical protein
VAGRTRGFVQHRQLEQSIDVALFLLGGLDPSLSFADLKPRSHINARAQVVGDVPDFSQRIRAGLPRPPPADR